MLGMGNICIEAFQGVYQLLLVQVVGAWVNSMVCTMGNMAPMPLCLTMVEPENLF